MQRYLCLAALTSLSFAAGCTEEGAPTNSTTAQTTQASTSPHGGTAVGGIEVPTVRERPQPRVEAPEPQGEAPEPKGEAPEGLDPRAMMPPPADLSNAPAEATAPPANVPPDKVIPMENRPVEYDLSDMPKLTSCIEVDEGIYRRSRWKRDPEGGLWQGTGQPDAFPDLSDKEVLSRASASDDGFDRQHALVSLGRRKLKGAVEVIAAALADQGASPLVRRAAMNGLIEHGGMDALDAMWKALESDSDHIVRGRAVQAIALYGSAEARKAIDVGLEDPDPLVKALSVQAVAALDDPQEAFAIAVAALRHPLSEVYQEGAAALSLMPFPEARDALRGMVREARDDHQRAIITSAYKSFMQRFPGLCN